MRDSNDSIDDLVQRNIQDVLQKAEQDEAMGIPTFLRNRDSNSGGQEHV